MKHKRIRTILLTVGVLLILYSFCAGVFGSGVYVPLSDEGAIGQSMNLNDNEAMTDKNGYIYMLGNRVVQRFNQDGEFCGGGYYYANQKQAVYHNSLLSLSGGKIVCYRSGRLVVFDENFNVVEKIENYDRKNFYMDYPNDDCDEDAEIKLGLFNTVRINGEKVELDAYRNMLFSSSAGLIVFPIGWLCVFVWLVLNERAKGRKYALKRPKYSKKKAACITLLFCAAEIALIIGLIVVQDMRLIVIMALCLFLYVGLMNIFVYCGYYIRGDELHKGRKRIPISEIKAVKILNGSRVMIFLTEYSPEMVTDYETYAEIKRNCGESIICGAAFDSEVTEYLNKNKICTC